MKESRKRKKSRRDSSSSSSSSSNDSGSSSSTSSSSSSSQSSTERKRRRKLQKKKLAKQQKKEDKAKKKALRREKKAKRKQEKLESKLAKRQLKEQRKKLARSQEQHNAVGAPSSVPPVEEKDESLLDCGVPLDLMNRKARAPETREEYEARQSIIRRVVDPETGRTRLIKGDGEIIEECVTRERHKDINRQATAGDGAEFQRKTVGWNVR
ncbi:ADP-ribosylation factor-like protein 6-interacting protein 4 [Anopheles nili]|uniref:ADP-ribosylation factor-like protein 6-interacting protein 4 n=1 Tax=Anopheles nili TaxID=185578 RepID=UPI00237A8CC5|nr:ADP-ribosylation factor-like protein 6-interacting protein 4 [Anopheles nili]